MATNDYVDWGYRDGGEGCTWAYVLPPLLEFCATYPVGSRVLDVGCGNGYLAGKLLEKGCQVVGIDLSTSGIEIARNAHPKARFEVMQADERVLENLGEKPFDVVVSTETVEHLYDPQAYARGSFAATRPGGRFVCSTPYHGYLKDLTLALLGKWDSHHAPLWLGGHIKFFSRHSLGQLMTEAGFVNLQFRGAGRAPYLWMSMIMCGDRPK